MKRFLPLLLLALVIFAAYAPAIRNDFVWDDYALVLRDPLIRSWRLIPEGFQHFLFTDAAASDFYRPIQRLSYTFDYAAFGFAPAAYHVTSIACHLAAAAALFFAASELLARLGLADPRRRAIAFIATLAWSLHPLHTSAVAYISGRADSLAAAFGFLGLYLVLRGLRASGARAWSFTAAASVCFLGSALSKEMGLIFLALWIAIFVVEKRWKAAVQATLLAIGAVVVYASLRMPAEHIPPPVSSTPMPFLVRPILAARAFAEYAGLIALPVNLRMERDVETHPSGFSTESISGASWRELQTLAGLILIAAFIYWLIRTRRSNPPVFVCLLLALITYLPVSGVSQLNATVAEHWLYLPTAFLFLAVALSLSHLRGPARNAACGLAAAWILFLGARTFVRTFDWHDQRTFLQRTIAHGGDSARMLINLGSLEMKEGRLDEAKKHLETALQKEPNQPLAIINLASVAVKQDDLKAAHELLNRAKEMPLVEAQAYELMAVLENRETGRANLLRMRLASRTGPPDWAIEKRYVKVLAESGRLDAAIAELRHCLAAQWYRAESWQLLSELERQAGRSAEAAVAREMARRYDVHLPTSES